MAAAVALPPSVCLISKTGLGSHSRAASAVAGEQRLLRDPPVADDEAEMRLHFLCDRTPYLQLIARPSGDPNDSRFYAGRNSAQPLSLGTVQNQRSRLLSLGAQPGQLFSAQIWGETPSAERIQAGHPAFLGEPRGRRDRKHALA